MQDKEKNKFIDNLYQAITEGHIEYALRELTDSKIDLGSKKADVMLNLSNLIEAKKNFSQSLI